MDSVSGTIDMTVRGSWGRDVWIPAYRMLTKCLAEHPAGLLLDLRGLDDPAADSAPLWLTGALHGAHLQPPVTVVACLDAATTLAAKLDRLGARRRMPVFATAPAARSALADRRPLTDQARLRLSPVSTAAAAARRVVSSACTEWGMPAVADRARLVISELVGNAVEHAGTAIDVVVSHRGPAHRTGTHQWSYLHLAVYDRDPRTPVLLAPVYTAPGIPADVRGQGLRIVDAAAQAWGALPTGTGKVVWAMLRDQPA